MQWLLALVFRCMRRRDDRSLAFFTPPLLGDKVSGNLEYSLLRRTRLGPLLFRLRRGRCYHRSGFLDRWRHARLIGHVLRYHQIGAHEPQHLSRFERQPDNPDIAARSKDLREQVLLESNPSA